MNQHSRPPSSTIRQADQQYDRYASCGVDDVGREIGPRPVKVLAVQDITEDVHRSRIKRGMRVLELGCGFGDVPLWIARLVGPNGLVVGVDESAEAIDVAERRATVALQSYWARFVTADLNTFDPHERFDVVVVHRAIPLECGRATLLRLSSWVQPDGVILIMAGRPAGDQNPIAKTRSGS